MHTHMTHTCVCTNTHWHIHLKTHAYTHQIRPARTFSDHPSATLSFAPIHITAEGVCVRVCVIGTVCLSGELQTALTSPSCVHSTLWSFLVPAIPLSLPFPPFLYLWINASHPIMSNQQLCFSLHHPHFPLSLQQEKLAAVCFCINNMLFAAW